MYRKNSREQRILKAISAGDLLVGFLLSGRSTRRMYQVAGKRALERHRNMKAIQALTRRGYVRATSHGHLITHAGREALRSRHKTASTQRETWDGQWRIITYDFPESERSTRNALRYVLQNAGFKQIQKSVWVSPFDSSLLQSLLKKNSVVTQYTVCMLVTKISYELRYRKLFNV
jgi:CRISPR-associated endonuclease Cas2